MADAVPEKGLLVLPGDRTYRCRSWSVPAAIFEPSVGLADCHSGLVQPVGTRCGAAPVILRAMRASAASRAAGQGGVAPASAGLDAAATLVSPQ